MKMLKKALALLLAVSLVFTLAVGLTGCNKTDGDDDSGANGGTSGSGEIVKEDLKIGFVHIGDENDQGYTYNHHQGTLAMKTELGLSDSQIITKWNVAEDETCRDALIDLVEQGCQIVFATSFNYEEYVLEVAKDYPEVQFCHATGYQAADSKLDNVHNYFSAIHEARYLAGIVAGMKLNAMGESKMGYVAAFPFAEVISGYSAFYLGAKSVCPEVTMDVMYVNSWYDYALEKEAAETLISRGCKVISQHSDSTGPATACEAKGDVYLVGYNADMISVAPKTALVSSKIIWAPYVTYAVQAMLDGTEIAVDWSKGLAEDGVTLTDLNKNVVADGTAEIVETAKNKIINNELEVFAGPLYDNDGKVLVAEGEFFDEGGEKSAPAWDKILQGITVL